MLLFINIFVGFLVRILASIAFRNVLLENVQNKLQTFSTVCDFLTNSKSKLIIYAKN